MAHSLLMVPAPELDPVVRPRLERRSPELVPAGEDEVVAHVTLLSPFADLFDLGHGIVAELEAFFGDVLPFDYRLSDVLEFPGGTTYLSPVPAAPFRHLTHELAHRFPEYPHYDGAFDEVVPHLSVPLPGGNDSERAHERAQLDFELGPRLPLTAHAREARLYWWEPGRCRTLEVFPFGTSAA